MEQLVEDSVPLTKNIQHNMYTVAPILCCSEKKLKCGKTLSKEKLNVYNVPNKFLIYLSILSYNEVY